MFYTTTEENANIKTMTEDNSNQSYKPISKESPSPLEPIVPEI